MSNLWRPALLVIRHKNVVTHAESLLKILNFEPEDECNSILVAAFDRISSRKYAKTQFESKTFLTLLIVTRVIYLSENWNNFRCREAFPCSKLTSFCFVCLIIYPTSWNFAIDNEECSRNVPARKEMYLIRCFQEDECVNCQINTCFVGNLCPRNEWRE